MIVRISKGTFDPIDLEEVERLAVESELSLRDALQRLPGLVHHYVGIDHGGRGHERERVGHA